MKEITQDLVRNLFDYKDGILYWKVRRSGIKIGSKAGTLHHSGYILIQINNKRYNGHQIIYLYHHGYIPKEIDHIDRNRSNSKIENLREATHQQNCMNKKSAKNSSSIYKGVTWDKQHQKWRTQIVFNNKHYNLGRFINEKDAAITYNEKAIELFGEFANLNIIEE